jgi:hypothetical protein
VGCAGQVGLDAVGQDYTARLKNAVTPFRYSREVGRGNSRKGGGPSGHRHHPPLTPRRSLYGARRPGRRASSTACSARASATATCRPASTASSAALAGALRADSLGAYSLGAGYVGARRCTHCRTSRSSGGTPCSASPPSCAPRAPCAPPSPRLLRGQRHLRTSSADSSRGRPTRMQARSARRRGESLAGGGARGARARGGAPRGGA